MVRTVQIDNPDLVRDLMDVAAEITGEAPDRMAVTKADAEYPRVAVLRVNDSGDRWEQYLVCGMVGDGSSLQLLKNPAGERFVRLYSLSPATDRADDTEVISARDLLTRLRDAEAFECDPLQWMRNDDHTAYTHHGE